MRTRSMTVARRRLCVLWFAGYVLLCALLVAQTIGGAYDDRVAQVWEWFTPYLVPTATLMAGSLVSDLRAAKKGALQIDAFTYRFTMAISALFLAAVAVTLLFSRFSRSTPLTLLETSRYWLIPMQGLANLVLGAFFVRGQPSDS